MRPPRIVILALFFVACLFLLCRAITSAAGTSATGVVNTPGRSQKSGLRSLLSFSAPFALFLPNAVITIAEDNTTSFAARPAGFGAQLPARGLNGQLWIGSGFTEETLQDDVGEGELGCSDVPGWNDGTSNAAVLKSTLHKAPLDRPKALSSPGGKNGAPNKRKKAGKDAAITPDTKSKAKKVTVDDGTDDYLHQALDASQKLQVDGSGLSGSGHADIQSIQEGAEIAGKIVLLSRGGCGFLEKVKWAQRRGAIALIVGDNVRGGALIQMYAHGDTSNVTIPSVFTSRTTAYLLSLMMQPGSYIEDFIDENGKPTQKVQHSDKARQNRNPRRQPLPGSTSPSPKDSSTTKARTAAAKNAVLSTSADSNKPTPESRGWLARFFSWGTTSSAAVQSRPPSSGQHDWVLVDEFSDEKDRAIRDGIEKASKGTTSGKSKTGAATGDTFQIGVQDWRDPDLVGAPTQDAKSSQEGAGKAKGETGSKGSKSGSNASKQDGQKGKPKEASGPKGGSITPGSGEYAAKNPTSPKADTEETSTKPSTAGGFFSRIFGSHGSVESNEHLVPPPINTPIVQKPAPGEKMPSNPPPGQHDGLWIVITPTSSASPFLDTLLVLVISPLITLTVVYALLILRARIRRRRWRAPKSVVERLPVRTYHTVASTPSHSPRVSTPTPPSPPSPTTPLLQSQHGPSRHRPRSRTTTGVAGDLLQVNSAAPSSAASPPHEKPSQWKKYMGRQVECVVCLEEYVDGVSQVMSLPCGHEFHVECM